MELLRNKSTELEFKLNLEGTSAEPEARLRLALSSDVSLLFKCTIKDSVAHVTVPVLTDYMKTLPSSFDAVLEVVVDECFFEPWKESLTVKNAMSVGVSEASSKLASVKPMVEAVAKPVEAPRPIARPAQKVVPRANLGLVRQFLEETGKVR